MNLRRFWISVGAITTFVVGVSLVAYATGKFTSEAAVPIVPAIDQSIEGPGGITGQQSQGGVAVFDTMAAATNNISANSGIGGAANSGAAGGAAQGNLEAADPVIPKNFLNDNFASLDKILKVGIPQLLVTFAGLITLVVFLINAVKYLFSAGTDEKTDEAKKGMTYAVIGQGVVVSAYFVVSLAASIFK